MDTKSKNYKSYNLNSPAGYGYGIGWIVMLFCTVMAGIVTSITIALWEIKRYNLDDDFMLGYHDENGNWVEYTSKWTGEVNEPAELMDMLTGMGLSAIGFALVALVILVLLMVFTGRFNREEDGSIHLNWYDRIWSEIHLASMFGFGTAFCFLVMFLYMLWPCEDFFGLFVSDYMDAYYFNIPNDMALALILVAMTGSAIFCLTSLVSLVKKLKAHQFWEKSLIGGVWLFIWRGVRGSDRTTVKVICYLMLLCAVAGWFGIEASMYGYIDGGWIFMGFLACMILILLFTPEKVRMFKEIRRGAAAIRSGNLAYKIPVRTGRSGRLDEFGRLAVDLNHIGDAQQIAIENELKNQRMKTDLISNVSHDLKTPLTSMSAYVDLLKQEGLDSPNAPEYLSIIDKKTQRLKVLTENLFEAAKASSGAIPVTITEIDLAALVTQSMAEMEEKLSVRGLQVIAKNECEGDPAGCKVLADGQLLWRVVENLLGNVSKYALSGSRVYVNISKLVSQRPDRASKVLLEIKNISADPLNISADELMERFKRGDESRNTEGSGLGLAIAKDLTALMNGVFEISIDGDLFKACVVLDEAESAQKIRMAQMEKNTSGQPGVPSGAEGTSSSVNDDYGNYNGGAGNAGVAGYEIGGAGVAGYEIGGAGVAGGGATDGGVGEKMAQAASAVGHAMSNAAHTVGGAFGNLKEKSKEKAAVRKAEKTAKKLQKLQAEAAAQQNEAAD